MTAQPSAVCRPQRAQAGSALGGVQRLGRNALLRSLRYQGERGFALMSQRWRAIQHISLSPTTIGDIVKAALVLTQFEHKPRVPWGDAVMA